MLMSSTEPVTVAACDLIEDLECQLLPHLVAEDAEELFASLCTEEPRLLGRVERLQAERQEMAEALDRLMDFAQGGPPSPQLAVSVVRFLDWVEAHQLAANGLMKEFLLLDPIGEDH